MLTLRWIASVVAHAILVLLVAATVAFFVLNVLPGDPAAVVAGVDADAATVEQIRQSLGLDVPVARRYAAWMGNLLRGHLGHSWTQGDAVETLLAQRLPVTLRLASLGLLFSVIFGGLLAVVALAGPGGNAVVRTLEYFFFAFPQFWFALILLYLFSFRLGWFPLVGMHGSLPFVLPAVSIALGNSAILSRTLRASIHEVMQGRHVLAARSLGIPPRRVFLRHALPLAIVPVLSVLAIQAGYLLAGAIVVEQVFSLPGLGRLALTAIVQRDVPLVQGAIVVFAVAFPLLNTLADLAIGVLQPHLRHGGTR